MPWEHDNSRTVGATQSCRREPNYLQLYLLILPKLMAKEHQLFLFLVAFMAHKGVDVWK